jgi:exosortase
MMQARTILVLAILMVAYAPTAATMGRAWWTDTYAGHGMFVPLFAAIAAWADRDRLRAAVGQGHAAGTGFIVVGLVILGLGHGVGILLVQGLSLVVVVAGLIVWHLGPACLRAAMFPVAFLVAMVPLPRPAVAAVTLDLQLFSARFAASILRAVDIPVYQTGVTIELPVMTLQVAEVCNGLRFLLALVVLTAAFAQATQATVRRKVLLTMAAVPAAILANATRVAAIALGVQWIGPEAASGTIHNYIGKGVWALTILPLLGMGLLLARLPAASLSPPEVGRPVSADRKPRVAG